MYSIANLKSIIRFYGECHNWHYASSQQKGKVMLKCKGVMPKYVIRRKSDGKGLYLLHTGEAVFTHSVSSCFSSYCEAEQFIHGLNLHGCLIVRV